MKAGAAISLFALALCSCLCAAQELVYTYVDENGVTHFTDTPRENARRIVLGRDRVGLNGQEGPQHELVGPEVPYSRLINSAGARYGVDPRLVAAVVRVESSFNPRAVSGAGAKGLMQLMDSTAADYGVSDVFDPAQNIDAGVHHLSDLFGAFSGDQRLALAAYNAGRTAVLRHGGVPPYSETRRYLQKIAAIYGVEDVRVTRSQIDSSYAAARALARGQQVVYLCSTPDGLRYSDTPPNQGDYREISLRQ